MLPPRGFYHPLGIFVLSTYLKRRRFLRKMKSEIKTKEETHMETIFEKIGGTYRKEGNYLLPDLKVPESPQIGIWGQRRLQFLRTSEKVLYTIMLMCGTLKDHLEEVNRSGDEMYDQLVARLKSQEGITEELKANDQMEWVQRMNSIQIRAAEIVYNELICA